MSSALTRDVLSIALLVGVLVVAPLGATSPYFLITPGGTYDIGSRLRIPDEQRRPMGRMAFTAVYEQEASWAEVARARSSARPKSFPPSTIRPPGTTQEQVNQTNKRLIDESKPIAAVVAPARRRLPGRTSPARAPKSKASSRACPPTACCRSATSSSPSTAQPIDTTNALDRQHPPPPARRPGHPDRPARRPAARTCRSARRSSPTEPGRPIVGVTISTYLFDVRMPFPVDIESDNVGGPSAGFMFALGILDAVTDGDLTRGYYVVGTGTIAADGTVGAVGGAAEKALAAEQDGAQLFLVPQDDYDEARRWVHNLQIVPIDRFDDAVHALCALAAPAVAAAPEPPTPCG